MFFLIFLSGPSAAPVGVHGRKLSSTSILVEWGNVPSADQNGIILGYMVIYLEQFDDLQRRMYVIPPTMQATLLGLKKFTNYAIQVLAGTSKGWGIRSEFILVKTDEDSKYQRLLIMSIV